MKNSTKRIFHILLILILLTAFATGGYVAWSWYSLDNMTEPTAQITVETETLEPNNTKWAVPLFGGLLEREFHWQNEKPKEIKLVTPKLEIDFPKGYENLIEVKKSDKVVFSGDTDSYQNYLFADNGSYTVNVTLTKPQSENSEYGKLIFSVNVVVDIPKEPTLSVSSNSVMQGDTLLLRLENLPKGELPTAQTDLSLTTFMPLDDGSWVAYTGIADSREPGEYTIKVGFKDFEQVVPITVTKRDFNRQDLWIDVTAPSISEANSDKAYKQFREAIRPLYETADQKMYWNGKFLQPTEGRISSEYGLLRYTNGGATPRRHSGIDIAAAEGTSIQAPADGRVVFSDYLLNTGNTLVIEHGGGLKTYYFHLIERAVELDDIVKAGQLLGKVGTTGYSTGPHLHFEVRIGSQNLDPFKFFEGTGGCFSNTKH